MSRRKNRRNRNRRNTTNVAAIGAMALVSVGAMGTMGYVAYQDMQTLKADAYGCFAAPSDHLAMLVDSSEPRFDAVQSDDLKAAAIDLAVNDLSFNERLQVITTEKTSIGSIPKPVLDVCGPASTSAEREAIGAGSVSAAYIARETDAFVTDTVMPVMDRVFASSVDAAIAQDQESPILEQLQSLVRIRGLQDRGQRRRIVLVSDLIQHTREMQACSTKGHLPRFSTFKDTPYYQRVKPGSMQGIEVTVYMLVRPGLGEGSYPYCDEDELVRFWEDLFADAGAASARIIRLRDGAYVQQRQ